MFGRETRRLVVGGVLSCALAFAIAQVKAASFANTNPITVNDALPNSTPSRANPYPSSVSVSGLSGTITHVTVTLSGLNHTFPDDIDVLLVGPGGNIILMSDTGGGNDLNNVNLSFDDGAASSLPDSTQISSGTYKPTNITAGDTFPSPAPAPSANTTLSAAFNGKAPNGTWSLYIVDDNQGDAGSMEQGWSVTLTTTSNTATTFANPGRVFINDGFGKASPYPSTINVSGLTGAIGATRVTLHDVNHPVPADLDLLLVGPNGAKFIIMSDAGGSAALSHANITLDDAAAGLLPSGSLISSGSYQPTNYGNVDTFPDVLRPYLNPATAALDTFASAFNGTNPNGAWSLYVVDDASNGSAGTISGGWSLEIIEVPAPPRRGELIISEFRLRGPDGALDEFVEIYNPQDTPRTVQASDNSSGLGLVASDGVLRSVIPNGTVIPAHGHYLCGGDRYSLNDYPSGNDGANATTASPDTIIGGDIPDNAGIALFNSTDVTTPETLLDAVGSLGEANLLYKEGNGYATLSGTSSQMTWVRRSDPLSGAPIDSDDNASDFIYVDADGIAGGTAGQPQRLGAPGPENLSSPILSNSYVSVDLLDPCAAETEAPNQVYDPTNDPSEPNDTFGKLEIRRMITNNTGAPVTRVRFRIADLTTYPSGAGIADLRVLSSTDENVNVDLPPCDQSSGTLLIRGTTLEMPPAQASGGGINSSLSVNAVNLATPLAPGASMPVRLVFGVQTTGSFHLLMNVEALPAGPPAQLRISAVTRSTSRHLILQGTGVPNALHEILASPDLTTGEFIKVDSVTANATGMWQYDDAGAVGLARRFYLVATPPLELFGTLP